MIILLFSLMFTVAKANTSELTIYYSNNMKERPIEGSGGLTLAVSKMKELKKKNSEYIYLICEENDDIKDEKELLRKARIYEKANVKAILAKPSFLSNEYILEKRDVNIPFACCNAYDNNVKAFPGYVNLKKGSTKIAILGLLKEQEINKKFESKGKAKAHNRRKVARLESRELIIKDAEKSLKESIDLLQTNFAPDIIILLTNHNLSKESLKFLQKNNVVVIPTFPITSKDLMVGSFVNEDELGILTLKINKKEIIDYTNEIVKLTLKTEKDEVNEKKIADQIEELEKNGKKKEAKKIKDDLAKVIDKPIKETVDILEED